MKPKGKTAEKFVPENTEKGYGATRQVSIAELNNLVIPVNDLLILFRLAKNGEMKRAKIIDDTEIPQTVAKNHLESLQNDHFIQETKRENYRNQKGDEVTYRLAAKGLIVAIICLTSPIYDSLNIREKAQTWKNPEVTRKAYYQTIEVGSHQSVLPSYDPNKERIEVPGLADEYYSKDIPEIIKNNQRFFLINNKTLNENQQNIAVRSAIFAAYKTGEQGLPTLPSHFPNKAPKGFIKASRQFPYLKKHLEEGKDEHCFCSSLQVELPPFDDFVSIFLSEPTLKKWGITRYELRGKTEDERITNDAWEEFAKDQELWREWALLLEGNPDWKKKVTVFLKKEISKLEAKRQSLSSQIASIKQTINQL